MYIPLFLYILKATLRNSGGIMNLNFLIKDGKQELPFKFSRSEQYGLIQGLKKIIDLPKEVRARWLFNLKGDTTSEPDSGLSERGVDDGKDHKFFFHFRPCLMDQLHGAGLNLEPHLEFLNTAHELYKRLGKKAEEVLSDMDTQLPGYDFYDRLMEREPELRYTLRFLYYKPGHEEMAQLHDDRSSLTFAVAESRPGLYFQNENNLYMPKEDQILAFNGLKAELHTNGKLKSMRHYVRNLVFSESRWAIVFFIHYRIDGMNDREVENLVLERKLKDVATA